MDDRTIDNLEIADLSAENRQLIVRWRDIVKPGIYRQSGGRWKKYNEPKFLRNERKIIEEQLQLDIENFPRQQQPQERRNEKWTVDPFWEVERPQRQQTPLNQPGTSSQNNNYTPMEEGEVGSDTDQNTSVLEVPVINWAKYVGVKSVQYIKMDHAPKVEAEEQNNWDLGNAVRETEKNFCTDLIY